MPGKPLDDPNKTRDQETAEKEQAFLACLGAPMTINVPSIYGDAEYIVVRPGDTEVRDKDGIKLANLSWSDSQVNQDPGSITDNRDRRVKA